MKRLDNYRMENIRMIRKLFFNFAFLLLGLLVLCGLFELFSWLSIQDEEGWGQRVSTYKNSYSEEMEISLQDKEYSSLYTVHPYLGFSGNPRYSRNNSQGFHSHIKFPYIKKTGEFVLGIVGGILAQGWRIHLLSEQGKKAKNELARLFNVHPNQLVLICLANGSHKQPQGFISVSLFLESLDGIIEINGYNEIAFDPLWPLPPDYPVFSRAAYFPSTEGKTLLQEYQRDKRYFSYITKAAANSSLLQSSYTFYIMWNSFKNSFQNKISSLRSRERRLPVGIEGDKRWKSVEQRGDRLIDNWEKYMKLEARLLADKKAYFFLQPNLHVRGSKTLTNRELGFRAQLPSSVTNLTDVRYKRLRSRVPELRAKGLNIFDLTQIFRDVSGEIYNDSCCKINNYGYHLMSKKILELLNGKNQAAGGESVLRK